MAYRPDILIRGKDGELLAVVIVTNPRRLSRDIVVELHRDFVAYDTGRDAPYSLLLSQKHGFLWISTGPQDTACAEFPMETVVARYFPSLGEQERLRGRELELILFQWLVNLTLAPHEATEEPEKSLAACGFLSAIQGASVTVETGQPDNRMLALAT